MDSRNQFLANLNETNFMIYKLSSSIRSIGTFLNFSKMVELFRFLTFKANLEVNLGQV